MFSIGLQSGDCPGHSSAVIPNWWRLFTTTWDLWHGAPSSWKRFLRVPKCASKVSRTSFSKIVLYHCEFMRWFGGRILISPTPFSLKHAQMVTDGQCFTFGHTYWGRFSSPSARNTFWWLASRSVIAHSSRNKHLCQNLTGLASNDLAQFTLLVLWKAVNKGLHLAFLHFIFSLVK